MVYNFTAEIIQGNEINQFIGIVPGLPGAHSQAHTLDELYSNLEEVIRLYLLGMTYEEKAELPKICWHAKHLCSRMSTKIPIVKVKNSLLS